MITTLFLWKLILVRISKGVICKHSVTEKLSMAICMDIVKIMILYDFLLDEFSYD